MSADSLQDRLDRLPDGATLKLEPPGFEFKGPIVLRKPVTIEGQGGTVWAATGPVLRVDSPGVTLADVNVEVTTSETPAGPAGCALETRPGVSVTLRGVSVRGNVSGMAEEDGAWACPRHLRLGNLRAGIAHEFQVCLVTPTPCGVESTIQGVEVLPRDLPAGRNTVTLRVEALTLGTRLRGHLLLKTRRLLRRLPVSGHFTDTGTTGNGQLLWQPEGVVPPPAPMADDPTWLLEPILSDSVSLPDLSIPQSPALTQPTGTATGTARPRPVAPPAPTTRPGTPHELTVSPFETGCVSTVTEALQQARPGTRILIKPGVYRESLTLRVRVELIGVGPVDEIVIESPDGNALLMKADLARVTGLTLRSAAGQNGGRCYGVSVPVGRLTLEDCHLSSDALACLAVTASGASAVLRRCTISRGAATGVLVVNQGEATLDHCTIADVAQSGVEVKRGTVVLRHCSIDACGQAGLLVHDNGKANLEDCDLQGNVLAGVESRGGGHPVLRRCKVHNGRGPGVRVTQNGQATLEDCDLFANALANLETSQGGAPVLHRCRLLDGQTTGAAFLRDGRGTMADCTLSGNARCGVEVRENAQPTLERCIIGQSPVGVLVHERGQGLLEECDLHDAVHTVVELRAQAAPLLKRCKIRDGQRVGVLATARGGGVLEECDVFGHAAVGVACADEATLTLKRCQVHHNAQAGVVVWRGARPVLQRCQVSANGLSGVAVARGGAPTLKDCQINDNHDVGLWAEGDARGSVNDCDLTGNDKGSLDVVAGTALKLGNNRLDD